MKNSRLKIFGIRSYLRILTRYFETTRMHKSVTTAWILVSGITSPSKIGNN
jgi:hypothetical protein